MDKKRIVIIVLAIILIILLVGAFMIFCKKDSGNISGSRVDGKADEMGIYYGGSFNEFQYQEEEENEGGEVDLDIVASEMAQIEKEFKENMPGDVIGENGELVGTDNRISDRVKIFDQDNKTEEKESENMGEISGRSEDEQNEPSEGEDMDSEEYIGPTIQSSGYEEHKVLCDVETQEEAQAIAAQIGGTVLAYRGGVATIQIEENVDTLLERLEREGSSLELHKSYYVSTP